MICNISHFCLFMTYSNTHPYLIFLDPIFFVYCSSLDVILVFEGILYQVLTFCMFRNKLIGLMLVEYQIFNIHSGMF